jgi:hypothetical protein
MRSTLSYINENNKAAIDELFLNGFNRAKAYGLIYPDNKNPSMGMGQLMQRQPAKDYYALKHKEWRESLSIDKYEIIDGLRKQIELHNDMIELASKDSLTTREQEKLSRLNELVKGSDIMKAKDMICRIIGAYEADKIEVVQKTYKVGFDLDINDAEIIE